MSRSCLWLMLAFVSSQVLAAGVDGYLVSADPARGEQIAVACKACHSHGKGEAARVGPNLYAVVGRVIASQHAFEYSAAMSAQQGSWDFETLDQFLADPSAMIPGTRMAFPGLANPADRAAVISWLRVLSDQPLPLPDATPVMDTMPDAADPDLALLPGGEAREEVFRTCSVCHSIKLVVAQGLDRRSWKETLDWMAEEQGMAPLDAAAEIRILDYLSENLGIDRGNR